jgi:hypothetical protein
MTISAAVAVITVDRVEQGRSLGDAALFGVVPAVPALAADRAGDGVDSPFVLDTFPKIELATAQISRMLFTSEGRFGVSRMAVWFVCSKLRPSNNEKGRPGIKDGETDAYQSTHCGKTDWKVSVQEHLITSTNALGLKRTCYENLIGYMSEMHRQRARTAVTLAKTGAAWAQLLMFG